MGITIQDITNSHFHNVNFIRIFWSNKEMNENWTNKYVMEQNTSTIYMLEHKVQTEQIITINPHEKSYDE